MKLNSKDDLSEFLADEDKDLAKLFEGDFKDEEDESLYDKVDTDKFLALNSQNTLQTFVKSPENKIKNTVKIALPKLKPKQKEIFDAFCNPDYDYITVCCGRQVGKSHTIRTTAIYTALKPIHNQVNCKIGIFLPSYNQCNDMLDNLIDMATKANITSINCNKTKREVYFPNGSKIKFLTTDNENARGFTFDYVFVDEACIVSGLIWKNTIQATGSIAVSNKRGKYLISSTPKDKSWFYDLFVEDAPQYKSITFTSYEGGLHDEDYLNDIKRTTADAIFANEYLAQFIDGVNSLFEIGKMSLLEPLKVYKYTSFDNDKTLMEPNKPKTVKNNKGIVAGIDWGFQNDYTVLSIFNKERELIFLKRYRLMPQQMIIDDILYNLNSYGKPTVYSEVNGVGREPTNILKNSYYAPVKEWLTTAQSKQQILANLSECLINDGDKKVSLINDASILEEFRQFGFTYVNGVMKFKNLKANVKDDCVMSIAIAVKHLNNKVGGSLFATK